MSYVVEVTYFCPITVFYWHIFFSPITIFNQKRGFSF